MVLNYAGELYVYVCVCMYIYVCILRSMYFCLYHLILLTPCNDFEITQHFKININNDNNLSKVIDDDGKYGTLAC